GSTEYRCVLEGVVPCELPEVVVWIHRVEPGQHREQRIGGGRGEFYRGRVHYRYARDSRPQVAPDVEGREIGVRAVRKIDTVGVGQVSRVDRHPVRPLEVGGP